jgi:molecular chaperone HtpG
MGGGGTAMTEETFTFQAEINQLMSLIINAFYSNKEVFLRELISNASDAISKIREKSLIDPAEFSTGSDLYIRIRPDKENKMLIIEDSGIGMTKADLINCIGTLAKSGTKEFVEKLSSPSNTDFIGQFGVGFYSAFLVADTVEIVTKSNEDEQYTWKSSAGGHYTIRNSDSPKLSRGTSIILYLRDDQLKYLEEAELRSVIKRHSSYITTPIYLWVGKEVEKEMEDDSNMIDVSKEEENEEDKPKVEEIEDESEVKEETKEKKKVKEMQYSYEIINTTKPVWMRKPSDISDEEYNEFYKSLSSDWEAPLSRKHYCAEGQFEFRVLLFVPKRAPFDLFESSKKKNNIKLYVRRVYITDDCDELVPEWLRFVKGIIDSDDLPLNISRETLQQSKVFKTMKRSIVKKSIDMFEEIAQDKKLFDEFYKQFSKNLKLGIHEDHSNRDKLAEFCRYHSTVIPASEQTSFLDYVSRMPEGQKSIYYITGESLASLEKSPFLEVFKKRGYEVLLMIDPIDEYVTQQLKTYRGKNLVLITRENIDLEMTEDEKKRREEQQETFKDLCKSIKEVLDSKIDKVEITKRSIDSPCCLVVGQYGWSANMERIMKAQALRGGEGQMPLYMMPKKTLELNPDHALIIELKNRAESDKKNTSFRDLTNLLYETALLASGFSIDNPGMYSNRIYSMMMEGLGVNVENMAIESMPEVVTETAKMEEVD